MARLDPALGTRLIGRYHTLTTDVRPWEDRWREVATYQRPAAFRHSPDGRSLPPADRVYDNTALFALRVLAAGLMSGMTSPARPWFVLSLHDKDLAKFRPVQEWLHTAKELILAIFAQSNIYRSLHQGYGDLGLFGTSAAFLMPDFDDVMRMYPVPAGEYALATNYRGEVNTLARAFYMTASQAAMEFGLESLSQTNRSALESGNYDQRFRVIHLVLPSGEAQPPKAFGASARPLAAGTSDDGGADRGGYASIYLDPSDVGQGRALRVARFSEFPALAPRWEVLGNDVYGVGPGLECRGDVKQLQHAQLRKAQAIDYKLRPPIQAPMALREQGDVLLPGGTFYYDGIEPSAGARSIYNVDIDLRHLLEDIADVRERIKSTYYADLFLMLANDDRRGVTATEVLERHEEKMLMLGPVLERLHSELLAPLVERTFARCLETGVLPPPPDEIQGQGFEVEFVSTLAQAQKAIGAGAIDQVMGRIGQIATMQPEVVDKVNADKMVDELVEMFGVNPAMTNDDETVAQIRQQRAQQQQAQQMAEAAGPMAQAAGAASDIDEEGMENIQRLFQGYS